MTSLAKDLWQLKNADARSSLWKTIQGRIPRIDERLGSLRDLARYGAICIEERWNAGWHIHRLHYDSERLQEAVFPGQREAREIVIRDALTDLPDTSGAERLREVLADVGQKWPPEAIAWARRLIDHEATGQKTLMRAFSTQYGKSKDFEIHRKRIETHMGNMAEYGIQRPGDQLLVWGQGTLTLQDTELRIVPSLGPIGLDRLTFQSVAGIQAEDLLFVENKEAFYAVTAGVVPDANGLVVYMAGNPGKTVRHLVLSAECPIRVWTDLDPFGVGFVRRLMALDADVRPWLMTPDWLETPHVQELDSKHRKELERQLAAPGPLNELLTAMVDRGVMMEQERQIGLLQGPAEMRSASPSTGRGNQQRERR